MFLAGSHAGVCVSVCTYDVCTYSVLVYVAIQYCMYVRVAIADCMGICMCIPVVYQ